MVKINPLNDKVLLERVEAEAKTAGGIVLPDTAKEKPTEGRIVATGEGRVLDDGERQPPSVKVGDRVLFGSYSGTGIKVDGKEYLILDEAEILAVVTNTPFGGAAKKKAAKSKKKARKGKK